MRGDEIKDKWELSHITPHDIANRVDRTDILTILDSMITD